MFHGLLFACIASLIALFAVAGFRHGMIVMAVPAAVLAIWFADMSRRSLMASFRRGSRTA